MFTTSSIQDFNPAKIVLTNELKSEFIRFAKACKRDGFADLEKNISSKLSFQNLIKNHVIGRDEERNTVCEGFELDIFGVLYYEYIVNEKRKVLINGIRWWITTLIAVLALLISCASLGLQFYNENNLKNSAEKISGRRLNVNPDELSETIDNTIDTSDREIVIQNNIFSNLELISSPAFYLVN